MLFAKMHLQGHKVEEYKNKIGAQLEELQARFYHFQELKSCFAFLINPFIVNVVSDSYPVRQPFVKNLCAVGTKPTGSKKTLVNATLHLISGHRFQKIPTI